MATDDPNKPDRDKPKKKADAAEVARRVEEVLRIRLDGAQYHDIVQYAAEKGWEINERQIRTYMARADQLLVDRLEKSRKKVIASHLAMRRALVARAIKAADYRTALAILDSEAKLRGLFPEKDIKELVRLAAAQGVRIAELEARLTHADNTRPTLPQTPETGPSCGSSGSEDAVRADGAESRPDTGSEPPRESVK